MARYEYDMENGRVGLFRVTRTRIQNGERAMRLLADSAGIFVRNAFAFEGRPVSLRVRGTHIVMASTLRSLQINTAFAIRDAVAVPTFDQGLTMTMTWNAPADMELRFAVKVVDAGDGFSKVEWPFLFATNNTPGFWKLPLPNQYDDGRLCLGENLRGLVDTSLQDLFAKTVACLRASPWNTDQLPSMECARALFRFDPNTATSLPCVGSWHEKCRRVSNPCMADSLEGQQ